MLLLIFFVAFARSKKWYILVDLWGFNWMPPIFSWVFTFHIEHRGEKKMRLVGVLSFCRVETTIVVGLMVDPFDHGMNIIRTSQFTGISPWFCAFEGGFG